MKKLFVKLFGKFNNMLSFEKGIDITDDYQVLKRKNIVIKNIIFLSNITYTLILFLISLIASGTSNWVLTIIFVPVTFGLNRTLSKLINDSTHDKTKQQIAMYIAAFYMILSSVLIYFKLKTQMNVEGKEYLGLGEAGYILIYYSLLVISLYQDKKMLISISKWMLVIITIIHFVITYSIVNEEYATNLVKFIQTFFTTKEFLDILLRTLFLILFMVVLTTNVGIAQYAYLERKNEAVKRQGVQTDNIGVVND